MLRALQYIDRDNNEEFYTIDSYPQPLTKKITLLEYFRTYMNEHLLKVKMKPRCIMFQKNLIFFLCSIKIQAGENHAPKEGDEIARLPYLRQWFRTRSAIVLFLSNGTLQINFFKDHVKIILCPMMRAVTYISDTREFKTYRLELLEQHGCSSEMA